MLDQEEAREPSSLRLVYECGSTRSFRTKPHTEDAAEGLLRVLDPAAPVTDHQRHIDEFLLFRRGQHPNWPESAVHRRTPDGPATFLPNVPGTPLSACPFTPGWDAERREICRQLLSALDALHRAGRVHGRLAPEHVFVERSGVRGGPRVTLVDLGNAAPGPTPGSDAPSRMLTDPGLPSGSDGASFAKILLGLILGAGPAFPRSDPRATRKELPAAIPWDLRRLLADLLAQPEDGPSMISIWASLRRIPVVDPVHGLTPPPVRGDEDELVMSASFPFVGRDREVRRFLEWIARVETAVDLPSARCILYGERGVGRHALAQQLVAHAETRGWISGGREPEDLWSLILPSVRPARLLAVQVQDRGSFHEDLPSSCAPDFSAPLAGSLPIQVRHLPLHEMGMLAGTRIDSRALIERTAHISIGNPALLEAILATIPRLVDSVSRDHPGTLLESGFEDTPPLDPWIEWAKERSLAEDADFRRAIVAMAVAGDRWPVEVIENLIPTPGGGGALDDLARRGMIDVSSLPPTLTSPLWESAWCAAEPELAREIARSLLTAIPHCATADLLVRACRLAIDLSLWDELALLLDRALVRLRESGRHTPELRLLTYAIQHTPPDRLHVRPDHLLAVGRSFLWCDRWEASLLPASFAEGRFPNPVPEPLGVALLTWARLAQNDGEAACGPLLSPGTESASIFAATGDVPLRPSPTLAEDPASWDLCRLSQIAAAPPTLDWLFAYLATRQPDSLRERTADWVLGLIAHPRFDKKVERAHLGSAVLRFCQIRSAQRRKEILADMVNEAGWPDGIRAGLVHIYQSETARLEGEPAEARAEARRAEDIFRRFESWSHHLRAVRILAELALGDGDLKTAYRHWRRCLQTSLELRQWRAAVHIARELTHCAIARGDCSQAMAACLRIRDLRDRFRAGTPEDLAVCELEIALRSGDLDTLFALEHDPDDEPWVLRLRGLGEMLAGHFDEGRLLLELAAERWRARRPQETAELLIDWLICETDHLQPEPALALYDRALELVPHLSAHGRARFLIAQGGLTARDWLDGGLNLERALIETAMHAHETDSGSTTWRAYWNLSLHHQRRGETQLRDLRHTNARDCLADVANTLPRHRRAAFLSLPGPRAVMSGSW